MTKPLAYNWWEGNTFRIPGLPVRPTYAPALAAQPQASPAADALAQLGFRVDPSLSSRGIGEMQGTVTDASNKFSGSPGSPNAGFGPGREAKNLGDFAGSVAAGLGMVGGNPFSAGMQFAGFAGPTPKTEYSWSDLVPGSSLFDWGGQSLPALDKNPPNPADIDTGYSYGDLGNQTSADFADTTGPGSYGGLAKGGRVTPRHLMGPNPPGPDDGFVALDVGEEVIPRKAAGKLRAQHGEGLFGMLREGKMPAKGRR